MSWEDPVFPAVMENLAIEGKNMLLFIKYHQPLKLTVRTTGPGLLILLCLLIGFPLTAQSEDEYRVRWINTYPPEKGENKPSFGDRVSRLVFGKKPREIIKPFNVLANDPQKFWILDQGAGEVFEVNEGKVSNISSSRKVDQRYPSLVGICRSKEGDLLFTDSRLNRVIRNNGDQLGIFGDSLRPDQPTGIACDPQSGDIWIVETASHRLSRYTGEGKLIQELGGRGTGPGQFNFPTFIWIDREGRIYVVDSMNNRIQIFDREGDFLCCFGEPGDATGYLARPKGIATDSRGHVYVADALFHAVQIFDRQGRFLYSFGNQGQDHGEFWLPAGIYIDEKDYIYVADSYNARVQIFKLEKNDHEKNTGI